MIQPTWQGPITTHKNRVLIPGRALDASVTSDPQIDVFRALGYVSESPNGPAKPKPLDHKPDHHASKPKKGEE